MFLEHVARLAHCIFCFSLLTQIEMLLFSIFLNAMCGLRTSSSSGDGYFGEKTRNHTKFGPIPRFICWRSRVLMVITANGPRQECYSACAQVFRDTSICGCGVNNWRQQDSWRGAQSVCHPLRQFLQDNEHVLSDNMETDRSRSNVVRTLGVPSTKVRSTSLL